MTGKTIAEQQANELLLKLIFGDNLKLSDCDTCKYRLECEQDNPDGDANHCLVS